MLYNKIYSKFDISLYNKFGGLMNKQNMFEWAVSCNQLELLRLLVKQGADIHARNNYALRRAAYKGHLEIVKFLVKQGADIHALNDYALRRAACSGQLEVVMYIKSLG